MSASPSIARAVVRVGALAAVALAVHTAANLRRVRRPLPPATAIAERVRILIPARDEAATVEATVRTALSQVGLADMGVVVLDDDSADDTAARVERIAERAARLRLVRGAGDPPAGWLGKPRACARLADEAGDATVLVFVDADVVLYPQAVAACIATLRDADLALVAPYPLQVAHGIVERIVQPLVTWSWLATLPVGVAERSSRPSLSAANGQLLVIDAAAYRAIGGHATVRGEVLEDIALMRALKRAGHRTATVDGSHLAQCRMYDGAGAVVDGYAKSLAVAFGGPVGSIAVTAALGAVYLAPALAMIAARDRSTRRWGAVGYVAGVTSRALVARRTGEPRLPDVLAHPLSIVAFAALSAVSWGRHGRGTAAWKGRPVRVAARSS